jgi:hypothetical protein
MWGRWVGLDHAWGRGVGHYGVSPIDQRGERAGARFGGWVGNTGSARGRWHPPLARLVG